MNCLCSEETRAQNLQNKRLERSLQMHKRKYNRQIKLLLLGTNGSGKSTFIRQMRYETNMLRDPMKYVGIIRQNIIYAIQSIMEAMEALQIPYETKENAVINADIIKSTDLNYVAPSFDKYLHSLKELWADAGVQKCFMIGQYGLLDSTKYFFSHLDRIADPYYIPSVQDILRARIPSNGFQEHLLKYKNVEFLIVDVGYQSSERMKWIHCFDNVTAIIYMVAISEYDKFSSDSKHCNSLKESMELFNTILSFDFFEDTALIVVFNKLDIFQEKITYSHLADYFPEYNGLPCDPQEARSFITKKFLRNIPTKRRVYYYYSNSTAEHNESILFVYRAVRDTILNANLYNFNLV